MREPTRREAWPYPITVWEPGENRHLSRISIDAYGDAVFEDGKAWREQTQQPEGYVFPSDDGGRLNNVNKSWNSLRRKAEIADFRWHDMRHHFASTLVMKGVSLNTVRELCGHNDLSTTLHYAHLTADILGPVNVL